MTIAYRAGEDWSVRDGAPDGVRFDVEIPSTTNPDKPYRIARQETTHGLDGYIVHTPACPAWRNGHRMCSHVQRALETAEDPLRRLAIDIREAWSLVCMRGDDHVREFAGAMVQSAEQAIAQADDLERYEERLEQRAAEARRTPTERKALADEAIAEFGGHDYRARGAIYFEGKRYAIGGRP